LGCAGIDVGISGERLVWRGEEITEVLCDPIRLAGGKVLEVLLAAEDRHRREVAVFVLDREVGDEARSLAGILDIASLQCRSHSVRRTVQGVAADDGVDRLVLRLCFGRNGTNAGRGEQCRRGGGPGAAQGVAPRKASSQ
jgi:hypothetical protein